LLLGLSRSTRVPLAVKNKENLERQAARCLGPGWWGNPLLPFPALTGTSVCDTFVLNSEKRTTLARAGCKPGTVWMRREPEESNSLLLPGQDHAKRSTCWLLCSRMDPPVSQKPDKASEEEKRKRKKKSKQTITHAVTHIRLLEANAGKLSTLDALMSVYLELCQQYTTLFCQAESKPDKWSEPVYATELSDRLHRVALQQAAGIATSWRTNRARAYQAYLQDVAAYEEAKAQAEAKGRMASFKRRVPSWTDWKLPVLRVPVMQANANVVVVEPSTDSTFDYWLRISTVDKGNPLRVPVNLASYHKKARCRAKRSTPPRRSPSARESGG